jgi:hypothetical protein
VAVLKGVHFHQPVVQIRIVGHGLSRVPKLGSVFRHSII